MEFVSTEVDFFDKNFQETINRICQYRSRLFLKRLLGRPGVSLKIVNPLLPLTI